MKKKNNEEFEKFNDTMDRLLQVPHSELMKKLEEEKAEKQRKKNLRNDSSSDRVSEKSV